MKIMKDKQSKFWVLSSETRVLYKGRRSPWDDPTIIRAGVRPRTCDGDERPDRSLLKEGAAEQRDGLIAPETEEKRKTLVANAT